MFGDPNNKMTAIENEKRAIEKIKERQKKEINKMIDYEIKMEIIKKDNEDKLQKQRIKEEKIKLEQIEKQKFQEAIRKKRGKERKILRN